MFREQPGARCRRRGFSLDSRSLAIDRRGDDLQSVGFDGRLEVILGRQSIRIGPLAITAPDHAVDRRRLGPGDRDHPPARRLRDPAPAVAVPAVVEVRDLVARVPRVLRRRRGRPSHRDVPRRGITHRDRVDFELVDAGLGAVAGREDRQADHPGPHRGEPLDVAPRVDHRAGRPVAVGMCDRLGVVQASVDPRQLGGDRRRLDPTPFGVRRGDVARGVVDPREDGLETVVIGLPDRVELVIVTPRTGSSVLRNAVPVAVIMSSRSSARCWSIPSTVWLPTTSCAPPTRKPVADRVSQSGSDLPDPAAGFRVSPASCSRTKRGNGVSRLNARIT